MSSLDKKRVSDPDALSGDPEEQTDEVIIERSKNSPKVTRRGASDSDKAHSPPAKEVNSDEEDGNGSDSKAKKDQNNSSSKSIKAIIQDKIAGKDKKNADKKGAEAQTKKDDDEEALVDPEKAKKSEAKTEKKSEQTAPASSGPTIMAAMKAKFADIGQSVKSRLPSVPTRQQVTSSLVAKLPSMPSIPRPQINLPPCPQIQVSQYLPELPSCPSIPLPEQMQVVVDRFGEVNDSSISPLIQRLNALALCLSLLCIFCGTSVSDYLVFMPDRIISFRPQGTEEQHPKTTTFPYLWTCFTSIFIEESFLLMIGQLVIINYIVYKNRVSFENAWETRDFYVLLFVSSCLSLMTQTCIRLSVLGVFKNVESYKSCRYSGLNFVVMALILGLRQQAYKKPPPKFQAVISETESKSGVKQITFAHDPFSTQTLSNQSSEQAQELAPSTSRKGPASPKEFDTGIPFILGTVKIPYGILPQLYMLFTLSIDFLFELPFNLKIIYDFLWIWFYLRFFMRTKKQDAANPSSFEIGDLSPEFGIHSFFPERLQQPVQGVSDFFYALLNMCGLVNCMRRWLQGEAAPMDKAQQPKSSGLSSFFSWLSSFKGAAKPGEDASAKAEGSGSSQDSAEQKKAALDFLDEEIKSLNKASGSAQKKEKKPSRLDSMAAKQMAALGTMGQGASKEKALDSKKKSAGWEEMDSSSSGAGLSGDLDFNDLEIQFDKP